MVLLFWYREDIQPYTETWYQSPLNIKGHLVNPVLRILFHLLDITI